MPPEPTDAQLRALLRGELTPQEETRIEQLLSESPELRERLESLAGAAAFRHDFETAVSADEEKEAASVSAIVDRLRKGGVDPKPPPAPATLDAYLDFLVPSSEPGSKGRLGAYEVDDIIAAGGMGVVFKAHDPGLNRAVAIKMLSPGLAGRSDARERFLREAAAAAAINHPNVIPIYAIDAATTSLPFIVMRYVEGQSLEDRLQPEQPLPLEEVCVIGGALAEALAAAHGAGLIHRDIKPSNVLLESSQVSSLESQVFLTDFGLARLADDDTGLTQTGAFLGTPQFMSPEQAAGEKDLDHRSDLFSLGSLIYTMATGRLPFPGNHFAALSEQVREHAPIPPRDHVADLPAWLSNLILRLLAKDPADRPASAAEVAAAIDQKLDLGPVASVLLTGHRLKRRRILKRLAVAAMLVVLFASGIFLIAEQTGRTSVVNALLSTRSGNAFYLNGRWGTFPSLEEAIRAADRGAAIVVRTNNTIGTPQVFIDDTDKPLTIRAAPGFRPVFIQQRGVRGFLIGTRSSLELEGLVFLQNIQGGTPNPLIRVDAASLTITNCKFARNNRKGTEEVLQRNALIHVTNCPRLSIVNSELYGVGSDVIASVLDDGGETDAVEYSIDNSIVLGRTFRLRFDEPVPLHIRLQRTLLVGDLGVRFAGRDYAPVSFHASNNVIQYQESFLSTGRASADQIRGFLDWESDENVYLLPGAFLSSKNGSFQIEDLESWRRFWAEDKPTRIDTRSVFSGDFLVEKAPWNLAEDILEPFPFTLPGDLFEDPPAAGPDRAILGPGEGYWNFRASPEYRDR